MNTFKKKARFLVRSITAFALLAGISGYVNAASISITNSGFEDSFNPAPGDSNTTGSWTFSAFGWDIDTTGGIAGVLQPSALVYDSVPEGSNVAWSDGGALSQVTGTSFASGHSYVLSVEIGERKDVNFPGGTISLFAGSASNIVKTLNLTDPGAGMSGSFTTQILNLSAAEVSLASASGELIGILLEADGTQVNFDSVQLSAVPLPPAVWLLGSSLIGLLGLGRLRRDSVRDR